MSHCVACVNSQDHGQSQVHVSLQLNKGRTKNDTQAENKIDMKTTEADGWLVWWSQTASIGGWAGMHNHAHHLWPFWHKCVPHENPSIPPLLSIGCWGFQACPVRPPKQDMPVAQVACTTGLSPNLTWQLAINILLAFIII